MDATHDNPAVSSLTVDAMQPKRRQEMKNEPSSKIILLFQQPTRPSFTRRNSTGAVAETRKEHVMLNQCNKKYNARGKCMYHPHIQLRKKHKKKLLGSSEWQILHISCPSCSIENTIKCQSFNERFGSSEKSSTADAIIRGDPSDDLLLIDDIDGTSHYHDRNASSEEERCIDDIEKPSSPAPSSSGGEEFIEEEKVNIDERTTGISDTSRGTPGLEYSSEQSSIIEEDDEDPLSSSISIVYLHDQSGIPYHLGPQCQAKPDTTAWNKNKSMHVQQQQRPEKCDIKQQKTRFIDEALGLPSGPVTQLSTRAYTKRKDIPELYYTKQEMKQIMKSWETDGTIYRFAEKKMIHGKEKIVGLF